ncbi:MAG: MAC/perforin domain-containing protein, partial [Iodobacter sp.]
STINKYQEDLSSRSEVAGKYNFFSGSIGVEFNSQSIHDASNEFTRIQQSISVWSLRLPVTPSLRNYLTPDFREYLDNLPRTPEAAAKLFRTHGSHFLTGIIMGGRTVYASATDKLQVERTYSVGVTAKASYEGLTGQLSAENETKFKQSISSFRQLSESSSFVVGGDGVKAAGAFNGAAGFDSWRESVGDSPDFVDFVSTIPMEGIWALCATREQSDFLKNYFDNTWGPAQSEALQVYADYIDELIVITGKSSGINPPGGYEKVPYDLNSKAGGDYIYLCYHASRYQPLKDNKKCITELKIIYGKDARAPEGFDKLPQDLNKGASGEYVYLCYKKEAYSNKTAIKGITVIGGSDELILPPYDFVKVDGDVNKGAGGEFVYICTSTLG